MEAIVEAYKELALQEPWRVDQHYIYMDTRRGWMITRFRRNPMNLPDLIRSWLEKGIVIKVS